MTDNDQVRWRRPLAGGLSRLNVLQKRHVVRRAVRDYLDGVGYIQIDVPLLVHGTTPDYGVESFRLDDRYLITSSDYQLKRLEIGGIEKVYSLTQNFRPGDSGTYRNPEFTMLEWEQVGANITDIEKDARHLTLKAMEVLGLQGSLVYQGQPIEMHKAWARLSVAEAIEKYTGAAMRDFGLECCQRAVKAAGIELRPEWANDADFLFSLVMDHIQPDLGRDQPVFVYDWPAHHTTSAQLRVGTNLADRSELFIAGIELGDGFTALIDATTQKAAFGAALKERHVRGQKAVELDHKYLEAMQTGMRPCAGMAIGFDRLVMLLTDQPHIKNVLAFAWDEL